MVRLLLNSLGILELLDELHFKLLHLHNFLFFLLSYHLFIANPILMLSLNVQHSALPLLFNLHGSQTFLLIDNLVLHPVFLLNFEVLVALFLIVLTPNDFRLFGFFSL